MLQARYIALIIGLLLLSETSVGQEQNQSLLDTKITIVKPLITEDDNRLRVLTNLVNLKQPQRVKDENGKILVRYSDLRTLETILSFVEAIPLPKKLPPGGYVLEATTVSDGFAATSIDTFAVTDKSVEIGLAAAALIVSLISMALSLTVFIIHRIQSKHK